MAGELDANKSAVSQIADRVGPLMALPLLPARMLVGTMRDLRAAVAGIGTLGEVVVHLDSLQDNVLTLNREVTRMRQSVEGIGGEVVHLRETVEPIDNIDARMAEMSDGVALLSNEMQKLEPHLVGLTDVVHPLRRLSARRARNAPGVLDSDGEVAAES